MLFEIMTVWRKLDVNGISRQPAPSFNPFAAEGDLCPRFGYVRVAAEGDFRPHVGYVHVAAEGDLCPNVGYVRVAAGGDYHQ